MSKNITNFQYKHIALYGLMIFLVAFTLRIIIAYSSYGGGDATNGASFVDFYNSGYDIYSTISPWPYLPFSNSFLWVWNEISNALNISTNLSYRLFSSFFDACIAALIFYYLSFTDKRNSINLSLVYALNPITVIIVSTLGFTDSFALLFLILVIITSELKIPKYKDVLIGFFLAVSISAKPMAIIFAPYFLYRAKRFPILLLSLLLSLFILNSYYLSGASFENIVEVLSLISEKMTSGHQSGMLGIGSLTEIIGTSTTKIVTVFGLLILVIVYILQINSSPIKFVLVIFSILLVFRYNFHPQYMAWIVPFAIIANRNIFPYLAIGGLSLIVIIFDWNDGAGAFSLLNFFGVDRTNNESIVAGIYQYLSGPILLGVALIVSMLYIYNKQFYSGLFKKIQEVFSAFPKITLKTFWKLLIFSLSIGYLYLKVVLIGGDLKAGIYLRALFLISLPTFIISYLLFKTSIKHKIPIILIIIFFFMGTLLSTYLLLLQGYEKSYNGAFLYIILITPFILYILFSSNGKLYKFVQLTDLKEELGDTKFFKPIFFVVFTIVTILLVFPWSDLNKSASNQFVFDKDDTHTPIRKFYDEIKINTPKSSFIYGTNYIYRTSINTSKDFGTENIKNIKSIEMKLLSDSYYMLQINGINISSDYGSFYYMRHSTKRKYYNYGVTNINLYGHIRSGNNKLVIVNNISSPVSPVGISPTLLVKYINGDELMLDLTNIEWDVYKGGVTKEGNIVTFESLGSKKLQRSDLNDRKYELDKEDLPFFVKSNDVFIAPKYYKTSSISMLAPVDIYLLLYLFLIILTGILLRLTRRINKNLLEISDE